MKKLLIAIAFLLLAPIGFADAGQILWDTQKGDVSFPGLTPNSIDNMTVGATTPATGAFTTLSSSGLSTVDSVKLDSGTKTAAATAGAATLNKSAGVITSESLTTAAAASYTLTLADTRIAAADQVFASVQLGTSTAGTPQIVNVTTSANQVVVVVKNIHATDAFNGTIKISFVVFKN